MGTDHHRDLRRGTAWACASPTAGPASPRTPGPHLRPVLHHQGPGRGLRPGPRHLAADRRAAPGRDPRRLRARTHQLRGPAAPPPARVDGRGAHERDYIVCVDDEQAVLNQLSAQLSRRFGSDYRVECARVGGGGAGPDRRADAPATDVQLVICDQVMPGMKGDRFLEIVTRAWPEIMKILLTGEAGLDSAIYAINHAGLHRYIEKPWEAEDLMLDGREPAHPVRPPPRTAPLPRPAGAPEPRAARPARGGARPLRLASRRRTPWPGRRTRPVASPPPSRRPPWRWPAEAFPVDGRRASQLGRERCLAASRS